MKRITILVFMMLFCSLGYSIKGYAQRVEGENYRYINFSPRPYASSSDLSGDYFICLQQEYKSGDRFVLEYDITVEDAGVYELTAVTTGPNVGWATNYSVSVNGEAPELMTNAVKIQDVSTARLNKGTLAQYSLGSYRLRAGKNKVAFIMNKCNSGSNQITFIMDYFEMNKSDWGVKEIVPTGPVGVYSYNENVKFTIGLKGTPENHTLLFEITDFWNRDVIRQGSVEVVKGEAKHTLNLGVVEPGWYYIKLYDGEECVSESAFSVVPPKNANINTQSHFAVDFAGSWHAPDSKWEEYSRAMSMAGITWARDRTNWSVFQPTENAWNFDKLDRNTRALSQAGVTPLIAFHDSPLWTRNSDRKMPTDLFTMYNTAKKLAEHSGADVGAWEIWNEEDTLAFADETADIYSAVYKAAAIGMADSKANPYVVFGGFSFNKEKTSFIDTLFENGVMDYTCAYNFHHHTSESGNGVTDSVYDGIYKEHIQTDRVYDFDCDKPLWVTESGIGVPIAQGETVPSFKALQDQAKYVVTSYVESVSYGADKTFWFLFTHYNESGKDMGTFYKNCTPYPAYQAIAVLTSCLGNGDYKGKMTNSGENVRGHVLNNGKNDVAVLWSEYPDQISLKSDKKVKITDIMGDSYELEPKDGYLNIPVDEYPIYVTFSQALDLEQYETVYYEKRQLKKNEFTPEQKIVLSQDFGQDVNVLESKMSGYPVNMEKNTKMTLDVYNFNQTKMTGAIKPSSDANVKFYPEQAQVSVDGMGKTTVEFTIIPGEEAIDNQYDLRFDGEFNGKAISPSVSRIKMVVDKREPGGIFAANDDVSLIDIANVAPGAKVTAKKGTGEHSITYQVTYNSGNRWFYPKIKVSDVEEFQNAAGLTFSVYCDETREDNFYDFVTAFVYLKNKKQYMLGHGAIKIKEGWHQYNFTWDQWQGVQNLTPDQIEYIAVGFNSGSNVTQPMTFKEIGWFYKDSDADGANEVRNITFAIEGAEDDETVDGSRILHGILPEQIEDGTVRVTANRSEYKKFKQSDHNFYIDLSDLEPGYYTISVMGYTKTGFGIDSHKNIHVK